MARKPDHRADDFDTDNTGGVLSGLLAEEDDLDRRALWRIGSWGVGAVAAVIVAVMANQTQLGWKRDQVAASDLARQAQQIQQVAKETQNEARRLASAINTLNGDRDRLYSRVTTLELGLDSVTGTIARQGSAAATQPAPPAASAEPQGAQNSAPAVASVATTQAASPTPEKPAAGTTSADAGPATVSLVAKDSAKEPAKTAKTEPAKAETAKPEPVKTEPAKAEQAKAEPVKIETPKLDVVKAPDAMPATPLMTSKSIMAPPDPAAARLIEPEKPLSAIIAAPIPEVAATDEEADEATAPKIAIRRTEFGVDLGTANSVNGLRALWRGLLKSRSNAPLTPLRPIIVVKEGANGLGMQLRLVAGPLNDAGAAAKICAVLTENKRPCDTAIFDGQRLSLTSEDPPAVTKPVQQRRRSIPKRATVVEEPPKKPETSTTLSSFFGRKNSQ